MRRTRQVLAMVVVTTALCADQVATAAPVTTPPAVGVGELAGRLVSRLSRSFRQAVPSAAPVQERQPRPISSLVPQRPADQSADVTEPPLSPFQFPLPPPTL